MPKSKQKSYSEKLKDPRWQKMRLKILERDGWCCRICRKKDKTLHVHHLQYGDEPWETEDRYLITVCADCHEEFATKRKNAEKELAIVLAWIGLSASDISNLAWAIYPCSSIGWRSCLKSMTELSMLPGRSVEMILGYVDFVARTEKDIFELQVKLDGLMETDDVEETD